MKKIFDLSNQTQKQYAIDAIKTAPDGFSAIVQGGNRSIRQNACQWPILQKYSEQLLWPVNGVETILTPEEWKDILTAAFFNETARVALGLTGGSVMLGHRTREFTKQQFSDWLDFLHAVAVDRGVDLSDRYEAGFED